MIGSARLRRTVKGLLTGVDFVRGFIADGCRTEEKRITP
jgi:hypothetical protein